MHIALFGKSNAMGVELVKEDNQIKMKFLVTVIVASRSLGKSTDESWLSYFKKGEGNQLNCVVEFSGVMTVLVVVHPPEQIGGWV